MIKHSCKLFSYLFFYFFIHLFIYLSRAKIFNFCQLIKENEQVFCVIKMMAFGDSIMNSLVSLLLVFGKGFSLFYVLIN